MRRPIRRRLFCEQLEARDCPSLTVQLLSGSLYIKGTPVGAVQINETAANTLQVLDNMQNLGTYHVTGNLQLTLNSHPNTVVTNLGGNTFTGSMLFSVGNGDTSGNFFGNPVAVLNGQVNGSIQFLGGTKETFDIGVNGATVAPLNLRGSLTATSRTSSSGSGATLFIDTGSAVGGDVNTTDVANPTIGNQVGPGFATVSGNVNFSNAGNGTALVALVTGTVGKSLTVTGDNSGDLFELSTGSTVTGNLSVNLGAGTGPFQGNTFFLDAGSTVGGNVSLTSSNVITAPLGDSVNIASTINGSLTVTLGNGDSTVTFSGTVGGAMRVSAGNGTNTLDLTMGTVAGSLTFNLGSGANTVTVGNAPGGTLFWTSGNGPDSLTLLGSTPNQTWNVNLRFGTGSDTLTLTTGNPETITGFVDMGGPPAGNTFNQGATWTIGSPWTLQNV